RFPARRALLLCCPECPSSGSVHHRALLSFPTRRSSDLVAKLTVVGIAIGSTPGIAARVFEAVASVGANIEAITSSEVRLSVLIRSEEHTSELQSRENLVCRLLLEKKKNKVRKVARGSPS